VHDFGEITLEHFAAFDKAGLTHPDLSRMKQALGSRVASPATIVFWRVPSVTYRAQGKRTLS
jgi:hypothetical protein